MKKYKYMALMCTLMTSISFTSVAAPTDTEESIQVEETAQLSGEDMEDVETYTSENISGESDAELIETSEGDVNIEESESEEAESAAENPYLETVATLTEEQVKAGYKMIDGKVYSPGELTDVQKNSGIHYGGVMPSSDTGIVAFVATLPPGIHDDVYVTVIDVNTYKTYQTVLYESNRLASTISLPDGNYILSKCGLTTDTDGRFFTESSRFTVNRGSYSVVNLNVMDNQAGMKTESQRAIENGEENETVTGDVKETDNSGYEKLSEILDTNPLDEIADKIPEKKGMTIGNIVFMLISIGIPAFILGRLVLKNRRRDEEF